MKKTFMLLFVGIYLTACGPAPAPVTTGGKTYGNLKDFACQTNDQDGDCLSDKYETAAPDLGPKCATISGDCNGNGEEDSDEEKHSQNNTMTFILAGLAGAVLGAGGEAIYHPVENQFNEWFGKSDSALTTYTPEGNPITIEANAKTGVYSEYRFVRDANQSYLKIYKRVEFEKPIQLTYEGQTFTGAEKLEQCLVVSTTINSSSAVDNDAALTMKNRYKKADFTIGDNEFEKTCLSKLGEGLYFGIERENESSIIIRTIRAKDIGFNRLDNFGLYANTSTIRFYGLEGSLDGVSSAFLRNDSSGGTTTNRHSFNSANSYSGAQTKWSSLSDKAEKKNFLLQNISDSIDQPISFIYSSE